MKTKTDGGDLLPFIVADDLARAAQARVESVERHVQSMANCWEEWSGNEGIKVGTRIEISNLCPTLAEDFDWQIGIGKGKAGDSVYAYMAPAKIIEVIDAETFIAEIGYPTNSDSPENRVSVEWMNGAKLRLDILDIWPPVQLLIAARKADELLEPPEHLDMTSYLEGASSQDRQRTGWK